MVERVRFAIEQQDDFTAGTQLVQRRERKLEGLGRR
jgi:hypothetical protein